MEHQVEWQYKVKIRKTPDIKSLLSQPGKVSRQRVPEWAAALISVSQVSSMFGLNRQVPALQSFVETNHFSQVFLPSIWYLQINSHVPRNSNNLSGLQTPSCVLRNHTHLSEKITLFLLMTENQTRPSTTPEI